MWMMIIITYWKLNMAPGYGRVKMLRLVLLLWTNKTPDKLYETTISEIRKKEVQHYGPWEKGNKQGRNKISSA